MSAKGDQTGEQFLTSELCNIIVLSTFFKLEQKVFKFTHSFVTRSIGIGIIEDLV